MKLTTLALSLILPLAAEADEVHLKNGNVLKGVVKEEGNRVHITVDFGTVTIDRSAIDRIVRAVSPLEEFAKKLADLKSGDVESYFKLGIWAQERELYTRAREMYEKVLVLDPDHAAARKQLGYQKHEGRWMTPDELMVALGFVKHQGEWLKRETVEKIIEAEERLQREREIQATLERIAQLEAELKRMEIAAQEERDRLMLEAAKVSRVIYPSAMHYHTVANFAFPCTCAPNVKKK